MTIGPVQDFIAAARRSRDLWAGSWLLSELSRRAAGALRDTGATLIFPAQKDLDAHEVVNRLLVETSLPPVELGPRIETVVRDHLRAQANKIFMQIRGLRDEPSLAKQALQQVEELLEIFWVGMARTEHYQQDRDLLEAALAARKNTRDFHQPGYAAMVPKSSIDGARESVIPERYFPRPGADERERERSQQQLLALFGAKKAERLSGVDLLKRHLPGTGGVTDFPSTSHFAALPWLYRHQQFAAAFDAYLKDVQKYVQPEGIHPQRFQQLNLLQGSDASILFAERLSEEVDAADLNESQGRLCDLYSAIGSQPEPYYAILHADGDRMGQVIDTLAQAPDGREQHQRFSRALDTFAGGVRAIVESANHRGALVYSGGDDVLAFLPLDTVIPCAKELAEHFANALRGYTNSEGLWPTLSVGVAIIHHLEPLSSALDLARSAEKVAKRTRNALAIILSKRSGADTTISGGWQSGFVERMERFTLLHQEDAFPDGAAFELRNLDERVGRVLPADALIAEALRILKRKRAHHGQRALQGADFTMIEQALRNGARQQPAWGINELADELIVAREFARARGIQQKEER
jgi:CRISPR-associated protein Cmr2